MPTHACCACGRAGSKEGLKALYDERAIIQFAEFYPVGHRSTNYKKWFTASEPYPIKFKSGYEPYVLVNRALMPWYDERFRGYGWDKVRGRRQHCALPYCTAACFVQCTACFFVQRNIVRGYASLLAAACMGHRLNDPGGSMHAEAPLAAAACMHACCAVLCLAGFND